MRAETRYSFTIRQTINNDNINTTNNNNNENNIENGGKQLRSCDCQYPLFCGVKDGRFSRIISRKKKDTQRLREMCSVQQCSREIEL